MMLPSRFMTLLSCSCVSYAGSSELKIIAQAISLNMRCESAGMRSKWLNLLSQLLHRIHVSSQAALHREALRRRSQTASSEADKKGASAGSRVYCSACHVQLLAQSECSCGKCLECSWDHSCTVLPFKGPRLCFYL